MDFENLGNTLLFKSNILKTSLNFYGGKAKEKYRGVFEIQRSGDKTSSGEIGLDIGTHASPKLETGPGVRSSKRPLLACRTRCICSMETLHN